MITVSVITRGNKCQMQLQHKQLLQSEKSFKINKDKKVSSLKVIAGLVLSSVKLIFLEFISLYKKCV
jgi:hypothetical protein